MVSYYCFRLSSYLDDLFNTDNPYVEGIYPPELQLNNANASDTEVIQSQPTSHPQNQKGKKDTHKI